MQAADIISCYYRGAGQRWLGAGNRCFLSGGAYLLPTLLSGLPTRYPVGGLANTVGKVLGTKLVMGSVNIVDNLFGTSLVIILLTGWGWFCWLIVGKSLVMQLGISLLTGWGQVFAGCLV